jgi:acetate kinase
MQQNILCINSGSSSIKFALYRFDTTEELVAAGAVERIGLSEGSLWLKELSRDSRFFEKLTDVVGLYLKPPEKALVLCVDETLQLIYLSVSK